MKKFIKLKYGKILIFLALKLSDVMFILLMYVNMPIIIDILISMSMLNSCSVELSMKKNFITWGHGCVRLCWLHI